MELKISSNINGLNDAASDEEIKILTPLLKEMIRKLLFTPSEEKITDG